MAPGGGGGYPQSDLTSDLAFFMSKTVKEQDYCSRVPNTNRKKRQKKKSKRKKNKWKRRRRRRRMARPT